jgi:hypothetical protein
MYEVKVLADPLFEKIFCNLIDNALRYGGLAMTAIRISSWEIETGLVISVEDDGVGISAGDKKHLFERGFGKHTGPGLFLSREILVITGITITGTGEPGRGCQVRDSRAGWRVAGPVMLPKIGRNKNDPDAFEDYHSAFRDRSSLRYKTFYYSKVYLPPGISSRYATCRWTTGCR